ncbi:hypothetical protein ACFFHJ_00580 [Planotetraspora thailandica]|nr:hypothetical protein [Planotetraspora thailandica]
MGLGKSIEAIAALAHLKAKGSDHFLVVCPRGRHVARPLALTSAAPFGQLLTFADLRAPDVTLAIPAALELVVGAASVPALRAGLRLGAHSRRHLARLERHRPEVIRASRRGLRTPICMMARVSSAEPKANDMGFPRMSASPQVGPIGGDRKLAVASRPRSPSGKTRRSLCGPAVLR